MSTEALASEREHERRMGNPLRSLAASLLQAAIQIQTRSVQPASVTTMIVTPTTNTVPSWGLATVHKPRSPETRSHGPQIRAASASSAPTALAWNDEITWPRVMWAQEVVIPHD